MKHLIFTVLPDDYRTPFWFRITFMEEIFFISFLAATAVFVFSAHVMFFEKVTADLKQLRNIHSM